MAQIHYVNTYADAGAGPSYAVGGGASVGPSVPAGKLVCYIVSGYTAAARTLTSFKTDTAGANNDITGPGLGTNWEYQGGATGRFLGIFWEELTTETSRTVEALFSGTLSNCTISVLYVTGYKTAAPHNIAFNFPGSASAALTVDVIMPEKGCGLVAVKDRTASTWAMADEGGALTDDYDDVLELGSHAIARSQGPIAANAAFTFSADPSGSSSTRIIMGVSFDHEDVLDAETGAYVIAGQAATFLAPRGVSADTGAYVITGNAAVLRSVRTLAAETGVYTIDGQAAGLPHGYRVNVDAGAYVISGQSAALQALRAIYPDAGAYVIAGQAAALSVRMPVETGVYTIAGQPAVAHRVMVPATGAYVIAGQAATLKRGLNLPVDTGAYVIAGQDANTRAGLRMPVTAGAYAITGYAANGSIGDWRIIWSNALHSGGAQDLFIAPFTSVLSFAPSAFDAGVASGGVQIRFTIRTAVSGGGNGFDAIYLGHRPLSGDAYDFNAAEGGVAVSFHGDFSPSWGTDDVETSDVVDFIFDPTLGLNIAIDAVVGGNQLFRKTTSPVTGSETYIKSGGPDAATVNKTSYGDYGGGQTGISYLVERIEVRVPAGLFVLAEAGAYTIAGQAAAVRAARSIAVDTGIYTISGQPATLKAGLKLSVDAGAYVIDGQDAEVYFGKRVFADAGAYLISGQPASLLAVRAVYPDAGAYVIAGQAAGVRLGLNLPINTGIYTIAGQSAGLLAVRTMPIVAGAYVIAGQTAITRYGHVMPIDVGAYLIAGQAADTRHLRRLPVDTGIYTIAGQPNVMRFSHRLVVNTGVYAFTGFPATMFRGRTIFPETGHYLIAGGDAILASARKRRNFNVGLY